MTESTEQSQRDVRAGMSITDALRAGLIRDASRPVALMMRAPVCVICDARWPKRARRYDALYCSDACRAKAYRRRRRAELEASPVSTRLLSAVEVGERLNVPATWVLGAARDGRLPCVRLGRYVRFDWAEVERWLEAQKRAGRDGQ